MVFNQITIGIPGERLTLMISGVSALGPAEENTAISGAGCWFKTVNVRVIVPTGFLNIHMN